MYISTRKKMIIKDKIHNFSPLTHACPDSVVAQHMALSSKPFLEKKSFNGKECLGALTEKKALRERNFKGKEATYNQDFQKEKGLYREAITRVQMSFS